MLAFYLNAEVDSTTAVPRTITGTYTASAAMIAWINDGQSLYYPVLLSCIREDQRVVAGVAVLALPAQHEPSVSRELLSEISHCLLESSNIVGANAAQ
jgi:hypothetical protein